MTGITNTEKIEKVSDIIIKFAEAVQTKYTSTTRIYKEICDFISIFDQKLSDRLYTQFKSCNSQTKDTKLNEAVRDLFYLCGLSAEKELIDAYNNGFVSKVNERFPYMNVDDIDVERFDKRALATMSLEDNLDMTVPDIYYGVKSIKTDKSFYKITMKRRRDENGFMKLMAEISFTCPNNTQITKKVDCTVMMFYREYTLMLRDYDYEYEDIMNYAMVDFINTIRKIDCRFISPTTADEIYLYRPMFVLGMDSRNKLNIF